MPFGGYRGRVSRQVRTSLTALLLILPSLLFLVVFTYYPIARAFWLSLFKGAAASDRMVFVGAGNYAELLSSSLFLLVLRNSLWYALGTVGITTGLGLAFALLLNRQLRLIGLFRVGLFYPTVVPMAAASMVWIFLFNPAYGAVNHLLRLLHLPSSIDWVNASPYALLAIIIVGIWKYAGYYMIIFLAGLQAIDVQLHEAARLEGASAWQVFRRITFPLLTPTTFFVMIIAIINSFQAVDQVYVMTRGGPHNSTNVLMYYIYLLGFVYWDTGSAAAASTVLFAVLLAGTYVYFRYLGGRVHYTR
jgi:sn-glycerol 3-phosphate transport system permease protein